MRRLYLKTRLRFKFLGLLVLFSVTSLGLFIFTPRESKADYYNLPTYLNNTYDQYISLVPNDPSTGRGNYTPSFRFLLYTPTDSPSDEVVITRGLANKVPDCGDFTYTQRAVTNDKADDGQSRFGATRTLSCSQNSDGFTLRGLKRSAASAGGVSGYDDSRRFTGFSVTVIRISLRTDPDRDSVFTDAQVVGAGDRLSYVGDNTTPSGSLDSSSGISFSIPQPGENEIKQRFAPPCNYSSPATNERAYVWWKDADSREDANGGKDKPVRFYVREYLNGYSRSYTTIDSGDAGSGGTIYRSSFVPKYGAKYEIVFTGVQSRNTNTGRPANTIKIWSPFDSAASEIDCPKTQPPVCQDTWTHNLTGDSVYKFSFFDHAPNITNPSDTDISVNTGRSWAGTSGAKSLKDPDYKNSNDGNYSTNMPNEMQYLGGYIMIEKWEKYTNSNGFERQRYTRGSSVQPMCSTASCVDPVFIRDVIPGSNNGVQAGQNFELEVNISGTNLPGYLNSQPLSIIIDNASTSDQWDGTAIPIPEGLGTASFPSTNRPESFSLYMPNDLIGRQVRMYIGYPNLYSGRVSATCGTSVNPYHRFDLTASANFVADQDFENPEIVRWNTGGTNSGYSVTSPYTSTMFRLVRNPVTGEFSYPGYDLQAVGGSASFGTQTLPSSSTSYEFNDPVAGRGYRATGGQTGTWQPGDQLCSKIYINNGHGWIGPGHVLVEGPAEAQNCPTITNRPYLSVYNGDVAAGGGGLGLACSNSGSISSYYKNAGSGAQFAAYAMDSISGFKSAFLRDGAFPSPNAPNGLSFGNTPSLGQYRQVDCATDFFEVDQYEDGDSRKNTAIPGSLSVSGLPDGGQSLRTSNLTLNGGGFTGQHSIFVEGDVFITDNIAYTSTSWANISEIPYFNLVVRGNIYISQNVTQLDGRYIAQPIQDGTKGEIYTCAYASDDPARNISAGDPVPTNPGSELWSQCGGATNSRRLVINGQFVARTVHFLRTIDTLSNGVNREISSSSRAGEVFNLSPEIFLGQPATRPKSTSTSGEYQKITTLPPIL